MKRPALLVAAFLAGLSVHESIVDACTTFCVKVGDTVIFGRNYDFEIGGGALIVNPRGLRKTGFLPRGPAWTSSYGSVTFNQFGRDFPMGGMNEKGLVVELAWLDVTEYPAPDGRSELGVLEWVQYQLDTAATVGDVIKSDAQVRIAGIPPLHYLVSDASGAAATIEFLDGRLAAHTGSSLPIAVLANASYADSLTYWRRKGESSLPGGSGSESRFARAATQVKEMTAAPVALPAERAFIILANVAQRSTRWTIVYDQTARVVHFRTNSHRHVRRLSVGTLELGCRESSRMLDLDSPVSGDISGHLRPYTATANAELVTKNYRSNSVTRRTSPSEVQAIAEHPNRASCEVP